MRRPADYSPLIDTLRAAQSPMTGSLLAMRCELNPFTVYRALRRLERLGVVERPNGQWQGWRLRSESALATVQQPPAVADLVDVLRECRGPVKGTVLADLCGVPPRTAQRWLTTLERSGVVERRGVKGGWRLRGLEFANVAHPSAHLC